MASHLDESSWKASYGHLQVEFRLPRFWRSAALVHGSSLLPLLTPFLVEPQHCDSGLCLSPVDSLYSVAFCTTLFNLDLYLVCSLTNLVSFPLFFPFTCFFLFFLSRLHLHAHVIIS